MNEWLGAPWEVVARVAVTTGLFYLTIFAVLRIAGRRTLAQFSAFDYVVTIAMGSLLAGTALSPSTTFAQGVTALIVLIGLQLLIGWLRQRSGPARRLLDFQPQEIGRDGRLSLSSNPLRAQLTEDEVRSLLREKGIFDVEDARLVILEPNGSISVLRGGGGADSPDAPRRAR